jgi:anti-sigma B factor antagonist
MQFEQRPGGSYTVVAVVDGRIDAAAADDFRAEIARIAQGGSRRILLDLSEVHFVDSTGLGSIIASLKQLGPDGDLAICGAHDSVGSLFRLTRMDKVFRIFATQEEALAALGAA